MKIGCLGWGSLVWNPENLLIQREWFNDGPMLPIEFLRQSVNGRLTLVIHESAKPVRALWALMSTDDIDKAKESLNIREGKLLSQHIGSISVEEETESPIHKSIQDWAKTVQLDAVIWTALPPKFKGLKEEAPTEAAPTLEQVVTYLSDPTLGIEKRQLAENYIRRAPRQIDTEYRRRFEALWGWTYLPS